MDPTEAQIASYIDNFREKIWPEGNVPIQPPRDSEGKRETKEKALQLINSKCMCNISPCLGLAYNFFKMII